MTTNDAEPLHEIPYWPQEPVAIDPKLIVPMESYKVAGYQVQLHGLRCSTLYGGWSTGIHRHRYLEVDVVLDGSGETATTPMQRIGPGTVFYQPPNAPHAWQVPMQKTCQVITLGFALQPKFAITLPHRWPVLPELVDEVKLWTDDVRRESTGWQERANFRLCLIISRLLEVIAASNVPDTSLALMESRMAALDHFLCDHLSQPLTLDDIADSLCVSRRTLTRLVHSQTGSTAMERLRTFRLLHAAELLGQTDLPLKEIAIRVGIPQLAYFCRCFRRHFDCTPNHYRQHINTVQ